MFTDINTQALLESTPQEPVPPNSRQLTLVNLKHRDMYVKELVRQLDEHNIIDRVQRLAEYAENGWLIER